MSNTTQYLAEMKAELQEIYNNLDYELRSSNNQDLIDDSYHNVTSKLESALSELDTLINDIDNNVYDSPFSDTGMLEDEE